MLNLPFIGVSHANARHGLGVRTSAPHASHLLPFLGVVLHFRPDEIVAGIGHRAIRFRIRGAEQGAACHFAACIILSFTGFQIFESAGGLKLGPYFHLAASKGPAFAAPGSAVFIAPLSLPAGAASGNLSFPASGLLA